MAKEKQEEQIKNNLINREVVREEHKESIDYYYERSKEDILGDYLVNVAILQCEQATYEAKVIDGIIYRKVVPIPSLLRTSHSLIVGGESKAVITDSIKNKNIFSFGNCQLPLSDADKQKLKENPESRNIGTCHCLMDLAPKWDVYPQADHEGFSYDNVQVITMGAGLFCNRRAWILPITSGQKERKYGYEDSIGVLTGEELDFSMKFNLSEEQLIIFDAMREYFEEYPELKEGKSIFAFEGVGDYTGGTNRYHPNGQFGAIFVYCEDGKPGYLTKEASTLPDYTTNAVLREGVYQGIKTRQT